MHIRLFAIAMSVLGLLAPGSAGADSRLDFTLHKLESSRSGPTLLVIGGIQGDEPGGFHAASLLATRYAVDVGTVWVVPNLNFESIVKRSRGVHGDMNRKFSALEQTDPEFDAVSKIKAIITDPRVDMVLNLHDGSGFYRPRHIDRLHSPRRWGQSIVIDQLAMGEGPLARLNTAAASVVEAVNAAITDDEHRYRIKNTRTREGNREMAKTLTYFAIRNGKPAAGVEASKTLPTARRAYYHLRVVEAYMDLMGIDYRRPFELSADDVGREIDRDVQFALYENRIVLDVADARKRLRFVPMKRGVPLEFHSSNPLVAVINGGRHFSVNYGNRRVTRLIPEYFDYDDRLETLPMQVDGRSVDVPVGSVVEVVDRFATAAPEGYRVNAIGFRRDGVRNENAVSIRHRDFAGRFSVDRAGTLFRVEIYRGDKFAGMVLVRFVEQTAGVGDPPVAGAEPGG